MLSASLVSYDLHSLAENAAQNGYVLLLIVMIILLIPNNIIRIKSSALRNINAILQPDEKQEGTKSL